MGDLPFLAEPRADDVARYGHEFAVRLAQWDAGGPELDAAEGEYFMAHADPDATMVAGYVNRSLSPEEATAVRRRLLADRDAFAAALPMFLGDHLARSVIESHVEVHPVWAAIRGGVGWIALVVLLVATAVLFAVGLRLQSARQRVLVPATSPAAFGADSTKFPFLIDTVPATIPATVPAR